MYITYVEQRHCTSRILFPLCDILFTTDGLLDFFLRLLGWKYPNILEVDKGENPTEFTENPTEIYFLIVFLGLQPECVMLCMSTLK